MTLRNSQLCFEMRNQWAFVSCFYGNCCLQVFEMETLFWDLSFFLLFRNLHAMLCQGKLQLFLSRINAVWVLTLSGVRSLCLLDCRLSNPRSLCWCSSGQTNLPLRCLNLVNSQRSCPAPPLGWSFFSFPEGENNYLLGIPVPQARGNHALSWCDKENIKDYCSVIGKIIAVFHISKVDCTLLELCVLFVNSSDNVQRSTWLKWNWREIVLYSFYFFTIV